MSNIAVLPSSNLLNSLKKKNKWQKKIINRELSINVIKKNLNDMISELGDDVWRLLCIHQRLNNHFIVKNKDKLDWESLVIFNKNLSLPNKKLAAKYIGYDLLIQYQVLPESFIEKHLNLLDLHLLIRHQKLSCSFLEKYLDLFDIKMVCKYQKLSKDFIQKNKKKLDWKTISKYQNLSKDLLYLYEKYIDFTLQEKVFGNVPKDLCEKYCKDLDVIFQK